MSSPLPSCWSPRAGSRSFSAVVDRHLREGGVAVATVVVAGDVDSLTAPLVAETVEELLHTGCGEVLVDLAGVTFFNAAAVTALARMGARAGAGGVVLRAQRLSPAVGRVLDVLADRRPGWSARAELRMDPAATEETTS